MYLTHLGPACVHDTNPVRNSEKLCSCFSQQTFQQRIHFLKNYVCRCVRLRVSNVHHSSSCLVDMRRDVPYGSKKANTRLLFWGQLIFHNRTISLQLCRNLHRAVLDSSISVFLCCVVKGNVPSVRCQRCPVQKCDCIQAPRRSSCHQAWAPIRDIDSHVNWSCSLLVVAC